MMKNKYYRKRDNSYYTRYNKDEIKSMSNNILLIEKILKEMDYPIIYDLFDKLYKYEPEKAFGKYIAKLRLYSYKNFGYKDSKQFNEKSR